MNEKNNRTFLPVLIGGSSGIVAGFIFLFISFITAFGICSDTSIAELLFPFSLSVDPAFHDRILLVLLLALIQYPIYGTSLGFAWAKSGLDRKLVLACALVMLFGHGIAVGIAKHRVRAMWDERFHHMKY